jgi:hypothetical protein
MSNGIEVVCEMASKDYDWSVSPPPFPIGMAFKRPKLAPQTMQMHACIVPVESKQELYSIYCIIEKGKRSSG